MINTHSYIFSIHWNHSIINDWDKYCLIQTEIERSSLHIYDRSGLLKSTCNLPVIYLLFFWLAVWSVCDRGSTGCVWVWRTRFVSPHLRTGRQSRWDQWDFWQDLLLQGEIAKELQPDIYQKICISTLLL